MTEDEKAALLQHYEKHLSLAKEQRDFYRNQCQTSRQNYIDLPDESKQQGSPPNSLNMEMHYTWDYAQQVHYPHHAMQVGTIYFLTPRKCNVFGVCSEASGKQTFYLEDEAQSPGKGSNSVISMAHHFFQWYGYGVTDGHNIAQLADDVEKPVEFFDWKIYLQQFFRPLKNITKYHQFIMNASSPGLIECKETASLIVCSLIY